MRSLMPARPVVPDNFMIIEELCVYVGQSRSAVYASIKRGELPEASHKRGARLYWCKDKVNEYLARGPQRRVMSPANASSAVH
jgi:predicted DNA-binding transcriptional regulator AlpA